MREFNNYLKENAIAHEIPTFYLPQQNGKIKKVNRIIEGPVQAIFA